MGFSSNLRNHDGVCLRLENPSDAKSSFMQAIEVALKRRVIKFEVDVAQNPQVVTEILSPLLALQKVLAKRGEKVHLICRSPLAVDLLGQLHSAGIEVSEDLTRSLSDAPSDKVTLFDLNFAEIYRLAKAQMWPKIEAKFADVLAELQGLIRSEKSLLSEIDFYKKRILTLRPSIPENTDVKMVLRRADEQEREVATLRYEIEMSQMELANLSQDLQTKQQGYRSLTEKLDPATVKRFEALNK